MDSNVTKLFIEALEKSYDHHSLIEQVSSNTLLIIICFLYLYNRFIE
jgi:hypothetical protein